MVNSFQYRKRVRKYNKVIVSFTKLLKSKAGSTALASAVKIDESSGIRCILLWLPDLTAQPTFEPFLTHRCKRVFNSYNDFAAV